MPRTLKTERELNRRLFQLSISRLEMKLALARLGNDLDLIQSLKYQLEYWPIQTVGYRDPRTN